MTAALRDDRIEVGVVLRDGAVAAVEITARRPVGVGRMAQGKAGETLIALIPRLFALCASAQGAAAATALASARGDVVRLDYAAAQASAVLAERLAELLRGTTAMLGDDAFPALAPMLRDVIAASRRLDPAGLLEADALDTIERGLTAFGLDPTCFDDAAACRRWLGSDTLLASLHRRVLSGGAAFGAASIDALGPEEDGAIGEQLARCGAAFALRPDLGGRVPETGALARLADHPVIRAFDTGLAGRLLARLIEIRETPRRLRALRRGTADPAEIVRGIPLGGGLGLAAVECARGRLYHLVELAADGAIQRFEILAPTEWNFHPRGPLVRALCGIVLRSEDQRRDVARLISAFDPCVGFDVRFHEVADA